MWEKTAMWVAVAGCSAALPIASGQQPAAQPDAAAQVGPFLHVGDAAPVLSVAKWVKGEPVARFESGHIYVVEFWATWCGPCIESMPHLTDLQRQFADDLTVIGVTTIDPFQDAAKVEAFVAEKPERMGYRVAIDDGRKSFAAFMDAAEQNGIPCSFVIDRAGRIAYIGNPRQLDKVLPGLIDGTWDAARDAPRVSDVVLQFQRLGRLAIDDPAGAVPLIERFQADHPEFADELDLHKFGALCRLRDDRAAPFGRHLLYRARLGGDMDTAYFLARDAADGIGSTNPPSEKLVDLAYDAVRDVIQAGEQPNPETWLTEEASNACRLLADICRANGWYDREITARRSAVEKALPAEKATRQRELENALAIRSQHESAAIWNQRIAGEVMAELNALKARAQVDPRGLLPEIAAFEAVHPTLSQSTGQLRLEALIRLNDAAAADVARSLIKRADRESDPPSAIGQVVMICLAASDPTKMPGLADVAVDGARALVAESERPGSPYADQAWVAYAILANALSSAGQTADARAALQHARDLAPEDMKPQVDTIASRPKK